MGNIFNLDNELSISIDAPKLIASRSTAMSPQHFNPSKPVLQIGDARINLINILKPHYNNIP
jgi:hypothetical protein